MGKKLKHGSGSRHARGRRGRSAASRSGFSFTQTSRSRRREHVFICMFYPSAALNPTHSDRKVRSVAGRAAARAPRPGLSAATRPRNFGRSRRVRTYTATPRINNRHAARRTPPAVRRTPHAALDAALAESPDDRAPRCTRATRPSAASAFRTPFRKRTRDYL
ncbi:hypothetical protein EVAR_96715_1 [Eumeta japonica]|uniref:Uncharacterized protein n=1 Tax=Eumeta variegata TaxID=151549 RepID=A0A4C1WGG1_EUMVA|nr:hypothetical protein EVAR_96715_1 [Eumeta japonica]